MIVATKYTDLSSCFEAINKHSTKYKNYIFGNSMHCLHPLGAFVNYRWGEGGWWIAGWGYFLLLQTKALDWHREGPSCDDDLHWRICRRWWNYDDRLHLKTWWRCWRWGQWRDTAEVCNGDFDDSAQGGCTCDICDGWMQNQKLVKNELAHQVCAWKISILTIIN